MTKVTGKFQITLPKRLVETYGIRVGDEVELVPAGDRISIVPAGAAATPGTPAERLRRFEEATRRQRTRERTRAGTAGKTRGWTRDELYTRGRTR